MDPKKVGIKSPRFLLAAIMLLLFIVVSVGLIFFKEDFNETAVNIIFYILGVISAELHRVYSWYYDTDKEDEGDVIGRP